jgi:hypothetical protein
MGMSFYRAKMHLEAHLKDIYKPLALVSKQRAQDVGCTAGSYRELTVETTPRLAHLEQIACGERCLGCRELTTKC